MTNNKPIYIWSYLDEYKKEKNEIQEATSRVFESGRLILGAEVESFEKEFAAYCDCDYGVGVANGTDAIFLALKALDIKEGDEVITVPNTAIPTVSAIVATGATPVFVDIDPKTYLMDATKLEEKVTSRTRCIIPVHLYGQCVDMDQIQRIADKNKLYVLEDCAQSTGSKWNGKIAGSMSDLAAFSFYPTKVLGAYGDGGMIVTNSAELSEKLKMLRMYGIKKDYYSEFPGYNSRLDELQAAILRSKLKNIDYYIKRRQEIAAEYNKALKTTPLTLPFRDEKADHTYYLYVCRHSKRDEIIEFLKEQNIFVNVSYRYPVHTMTGFKDLGHKEGDFPVTEKCSDEIFSIPVYPEFSEQDQTRVIQALQAFFEKHGG